VGAGYGFVDGAIGGAVVAAIYNQFVHQGTGIQAGPTHTPAAALNKEVVA
jgi:hypothetical protein